MPESFKEFCEGFIGSKGNFFQRDELFSIVRLREQYNQIKKAYECNLKRGAIKTND